VSMDGTPVVLGLVSCVLSAKPGKIQGRVVENDLEVVSRCLKKGKAIAENTVRERRVSLSYSRLG
jgi:hypothetical protein